MYIAFFDLDHTILSISSGRIMFRGSYAHGLIGKKEIRKAVVITVLYRLGLMSAESAIARWVGWYRGMTIDRIKSAEADWTGELLSVIRGDARREVKFHRDNGARTVILSASTTFFCNNVKNELGMDDVICTELEFENGRFTGKLKSRYCYGNEKLIRAQQYCQDKGVEMKDAYYYADSIADLPVFEAVGNPVCVTPDKKLERIASKRGWKICRWK